MIHQNSSNTKCGDHPLKLDFFRCWFHRLVQRPLPRPAMFVAIVTAWVLRKLVSKTSKPIGLGWLLGNFTGKPLILPSNMGVNTVKCPTNQHLVGLVETLQKTTIQTEDNVFRNGWIVTVYCDELRGTRNDQRIIRWCHPNWDPNIFSAAGSHDLCLSRHVFRLGVQQLIGPEPADMKRWSIDVGFVVI